MSAVDHPADFDALLDSAIESGDVNKLAYLLSFELTSKVFQKLAALPSALLPGLGLQPFSLYAVCNSTMDLLAPVLKGAAVQGGIELQIQHNGFSEHVDCILNESSSLYTTAPDGLLLAFDYTAFENDPGLPAMLLSEVKKRFRGKLFVQTVPPAPKSLMGNEHCRGDDALMRAIREFNEASRSVADYLVDIERLAITVGLANWYNEAYFHLAKVPFDPSFGDAYARRITAALGLAIGRNGKCLVLDLDNTLWGGVVGDDGMPNIQLGPGSPAGEAFQEFQRTILAYKNLGVILAVCSKNEYDVAREPFTSHPDMLIKESDIVVFVANWQDKASNIRSIASRLNISLDSLVFVDDNPAEREQVRRELPMVKIVPLPRDPSQYSRTLIASGFLERGVTTEEDMNRTGQYQARFESEELQQRSGSYAEYLQSLEMTAQVGHFDSVSMPRATQLINKTNQFNFTTRRYSDSEIAEFVASSDYGTLQIRLQDKFADHGIIAAVIYRIDQKVLNVDTWVMSCRVFKRQVEDFTLNELVRIAKEAGLNRVQCPYIPTAKNGILVDVLDELGFRAAAGTADSASTWEINVDRFSAQTIHINETSHHA